MDVVLWPHAGVGTPLALGGKGLALWRLQQYDLPVPPVFCLTTAAYHLWYQAGKPDYLPPTLQATLHSALERLAAQTPETTGYAVRSSAVAEDTTEASFAGQLQTRLNVPVDQVAAAVVAVWRSADATGLTAYQTRMQRQQGDVAVLVQPLLSAEVSGVLFTVDPVSGGTDNLVLNATWGLGEGLVNGVMTPDHWVVDRASGQIRSQQIGDKARMVVALASGGTTVVATPDEQQRQITLTPVQVAELVTLALQVEHYFEAPQDIEWAYAHGRFWLLQARPITTLTDDGLDSPTDAHTVWTAANIQEVIPGLLRPLSWSLVETYLSYGFRRVLLSTGTLEDPTVAFLALFYHRPFLNVTALRRVARRAFGTSPEAVDEQYLGVQRPPQSSTPGLSLSQLGIYSHTLPRALWMLYRTPGRVRQETARLQPWMEHLYSQDFSHLAQSKLLDWLEEAHEASHRMSALHIATTAGASVAFETLHRVVQKSCGAATRGLVARLSAGLHQVASAAPGLELVSLAALVQADEGLGAALLSADPWTQVQALSGPAATALRERLGQFLQRYGHRGVMEFDIAAPTWAEDPNSVLKLLGNILTLPAASTSNRVSAEPEAERLAALQVIRQRLTLPGRWRFHLVLRQAHAYLQFREHTKSLWIGVMHGLRLLFRELGRRLTAQHLLSDPDDIYFLTYAELQSLLRQQDPPFAVAGLIRRRRAHFTRSQHVRLPTSFQGRPQPLPPVAAVSTDTVLRGIPVSPGVVTGPARVILDPRRETTLQAGEILVAPVTDAGWTPLFLIATGLVVDVGGPLSHGAIVAREYGLPTVVNVKVGTQVIHTGDLLTLNGSTGEIWRHPRGPGAAPPGP